MKNPGAATVDQPWEPSLIFNLQRWGWGAVFYLWPPTAPGGPPSAAPFSLLPSAGAQAGPDPAGEGVGRVAWQGPRDRGAAAPPGGEGAAPAGPLDAPRRRRRRAGPRTGP